MGITLSLYRSSAGSSDLDCAEVCSVAVSCQGDLKPRCIAFAVSSREVRKRRPCRDMLDVLNLIVGTFVKVRISADCARSKAAAAAGFEFLLTHTCSPSRMEVHDLLSIVLEALVNFVAGPRCGLDATRATPNAALRLPPDDTQSPSASRAAGNFCLSYPRCARGKYGPA